jgi:natural product biosynthesis luciferase-like monooxygenase protein
MRAVFCGNGTLLVQCASTFAQAGGAILAVVSDDTRVVDWAKGESIAVIPLSGIAAASVPDCDILFSVANLTVLPDAVIARAGKGGINFHDGPLPTYSGLNVPAWAIMAGEGRHAVTWHEMVTGVDRGRVLKSREIEIAADETAFSLNAKCYGAGLESFAELVADLMAGRLAPVAQAGTRGWYGKARRPANLAVLDWARPAGDLARLVRGLDFGAYANPLAMPKLWTGSRMIVATSAEALDGSGLPGTVLSSDATTLTVATAEGALRLGKLAGLDGQPLTAAVVPAGTVLPVAPALEDAMLKAVGHAEEHWRAVLDAAAPAIPPHVAGHSVGTATMAESLSLPSGMDGDGLAAAWAAWTGLLSGLPEVTLVLDGAAMHPALSGPRPAQVSVAPDMTASAVVAAVRAAREGDRAPMAGDLALRLADTEHRSRAVAALASVVSGHDRPDLPAGCNLCVTPLRILSREGLFTPSVLKALAAQFSGFATAFFTAGSAPVGKLDLAPADPAMARLGDAFARDLRVHQAFEAMVAARPDAMALEAGSVKLSYAELDRRASALAGALADRGARPGTVVGLCHERNADLGVALLAILKTGAAYLPLDPNYPADRIAYMIGDSGAPLIVASAAAASRLALDPAKVVSPSATGTAPLADGSPEDLAYLIYTSGSTGKPKGVMVRHRNVLNFFAGMDEKVPLKDGARLLAVTSISFDISVLEIFWVLSRGATVVLQVDGAGETKLPAFSLFYFASEASGSGHHAYRLLLEGARFADENGFEAVWNPERHFHAFGGLYPNPAVSLAAVAGFTKNVKLRGGSCVLPLHHPVRAAEDWSLLDNLSNGRAGIAIASGWQPNDFILNPANFEPRKDVMLQGVETLRALWAGEAVGFPNHKGETVQVQIHPRPVQKTIPLWITAAGNPETFAAAARQGCGVLTHLLGQTFDEVSEKIRAYRVAWRESGHPGTGTVTLMLHTFVGDEEGFVRETVRGPMKGYLKSATDLIKRASWSFPTFVQKGSAQGMTPQQVFEKEDLKPEEMDALLDHAFERYYRTSGLFGTVEGCKEIVRNVAAMGVDEIACLIDFGVDTDLALANLPNIKRLMVALEEEGNVGRRASVAEQIVEGAVTHMQCTPSMASFLVADAPGRTALGKLDVLMVGGEALPPDLAKALRGNMNGALLNMYGPTETTVWSSVARLDMVGDRIPLGGPIANTALSVRSEAGHALPEGVAGELWIGGAGVTAGYWQRPDLTAERFVEAGGETWYRTGDLVRRMPDGAMDFLGRIDNQVKIRGHRIELGEIEALLAAQAGVREAVVTAFAEPSGDRRLVGYVTAEAGARPDAATLKAALAGGLPDIMVPSQIVTLDRMPLTPNGKVDRKALPSPTARTETAAVAAATDTEGTIAAIWREALGLSEVGMTDNFFDLGGHSLLVVQVQRQLKDRLGQEVAITDMFRFSTIRALAAHLSGAATGEPSAASRGAARAAERLARLGRR